MSSLPKRIDSKVPGPIVTDKEIVHTRLLDAPRDLVFRVWTDPKHVAVWWGPNGFTNTIYEMDVKPGGIWRFMMHSAEGIDFPNKVTVIEVIKPKRLVYVHSSDQPNDPREFHVTVTFEAKGRKTQLTMHATFKTAAAFDEVKKFGAVEGGVQTLNRLESFLRDLERQTGKLQKNKDGYQVRFERDLPYSAKVVWDAITDPEKLAVWFTDVKMDFVAGGKMSIRFRDADKTESFGKVVRIEPPRLFEYSWEDELATWEVIPKDETHCTLILTYSRLPHDYAISVSAGWHVILDQLEEALLGKKDFPPFGGGETEETRFMKSFYEEITTLE